MCDDLYRKVEELELRLAAFEDFIKSIGYSGVTLNHECDCPYRHGYSCTCVSSIWIDLKDSI